MYWFFIAQSYRQLYILPFAFHNVRSMVTKCTYLVSVLGNQIGMFQFAIRLDTDNVFKYDP